MTASRLCLAVLQDQCLSVCVKTLVACTSHLKWTWAQAVLPAKLSFWYGQQRYYAGL